MVHLGRLCVAAMALIVPGWLSPMTVIAQPAIQRSYTVEELLDSSGESRSQGRTESRNALASYRDPLENARYAAHWKGIFEGKTMKSDGSPYTHQERIYARSLSQNLTTRMGLEESKGGSGRRLGDWATTSVPPGLLFLAGGVNSDAYQKIRDAREHGDLVTQADFEYFGRPESGGALRLGPTLMETMRVDLLPVVILGAAAVATLLCFAYTMRTDRVRSSRERSFRHWKEGLKLGVGFASWMIVANSFSPKLFSDRLADSAGPFVVALGAALLVGIVTGAAATSITDRGLKGDRIALFAWTIVLTFAQVGLFSGALAH